MNISTVSSFSRRASLPTWRRFFSFGATLLALALPLPAQTLNYAEGGDPTDDPAATDGVPASLRRYVDSVNGDDNNDGQSPAAAWKTLAKVNAGMASYQPGAYVLFKRGQSFAGSLSLGGANGSSGNRIVIGAYGPGHSNGDGDPFNDSRPNFTGNTNITGGVSWLMLRDLDTGKIGASSGDGGHASDVVIFNNVVHGRAGENQSNMIRLNDGDTRCAIVQNLAYDSQSNDVIALHDGGTATSAIGPSHWIVDNVILGNDGAESGIDLAIAGEASGILHSDFKIIGNRLQLQSGKVPGVTQLYAGAAQRGIEGGHLVRHTWVLGNMVTGAKRTGHKRSGQVQYNQVVGNIIWRCGTEDLPLVELASRDTLVEHNTLIYTRADAGRQVLRLNNETGGFAAENTTLLRNLFIRTTDGAWFGTWSTAPSVIAAMNWNWYGENITGTVAGQTLANWRSATGRDLDSSSGDVPGVAVPTTSAFDENPKNWYGAAFLDYFTPDSGWAGDSMGDGTPAGALKSDGSWYGGGPALAGKWNPDHMRPYATLALNNGYGWEGPLLIQQRYPLPTLLAPSNLTATAVSPTQIDLSWTDTTTDETAFRIQRKEGEGGAYADTTPATVAANTVTFSDTGVADNTTYFYQVRAENADGTSAWSAEAGATTPEADTTAPEITTLTATPDHLWPANHKMVAVTLVATATDNKDPAPVTKILSVTSSEAANGSGDGNTATDWAITGDLTLDLRAERSGNGPVRLYTVTVQSTDASGNSSTAVVLIPVGHNNDTQPPTVALTAPANGALVGGAIALAATASDNDSVVGVQFKLDGANLGVEDSSAPYGLSWNTTGASNGNHTLTAVARDENGNTATSAPVIVFVDNAPPAVAVTAPTAGSLLTGGGHVLTATATDNVAVAAVQFQVDGAAVGAELTAAPYEFIWDSATVADGNHTITATARDTLGNTATSAAVAVTSDNLAPTVAITVPAANAVVGGAAVTLSATAGDLVGVTGVQFFVDGNPVGAEDTTAPYGVAWDSTAAANGSHTLTAIARDGVGHTTVSAAVNVTVDNTPPTVALTAPAAGATVAGSAVAVAATAMDDTTVASVQFKLDGVNLGAADTTAPYSVNWNSTTAANGAHTLTAVARDTVGNTTTSAPVGVTVNNAAPALYEAESLTITAQSASVVLTAAAGASNGQYVLMNSNTVGQSITYTVNVATAGSYLVGTGLATQGNRGIFQLQIDGVNLGTPVDYYTPGAVAQFSERSLGVVTLAAGPHSFRFLLTGKNPAASNQKHALDYIELTPQ